MRVKAKEKGYYGTLRKPDDVFVLTEVTDEDGEVVSTIEDQFSARWMVEVDADGNEVGADKPKAKAKAKKKAPQMKTATNAN